MLSWYVFADLPWNFFGYFNGYLMAIGFGHFDTMFLGNLFGHIMANFFGNLETIRVIYYGVLTRNPTIFNIIYWVAGSFVSLTNRLMVQVLF